MNTNLTIDPKNETEKIVRFLRQTLKRQGFDHVVIGASGGIDSTTSLYLLKETMPAKNIFPVHLHYFESSPTKLNEILNSIRIPLKNRLFISIKTVVDAIANKQHITNYESQENKIRLGNIMARIRMIFLYDLAKKNHALVCGTENRSEHYLAYFTRFGDEASDFEPILRLYKTQVYQLAKYLGVLRPIIKKTPTAGLWEEQTDEGEFGFTYQEADQVLCLYFDEKLSINEIKKRGLKNAEKIIAWVKQNAYKHHTPYTL